MASRRLRLRKNRANLAAAEWWRRKRQELLTNRRKIVAVVSPTLNHRQRIRQSIRKIYRRRSVPPHQIRGIRSSIRNTRKSSKSWRRSRTRNGRNSSNSKIRSTRTWRSKRLTTPGRSNWSRSTSNRQTNCNKDTQSSNSSCRRAKLRRQGLGNSTLVFAESKGLILETLGRVRVSPGRRFCWAQVPVMQSNLASSSPEAAIAKMLKWPLCRFPKNEARSNSEERSYGNGSA